MLMKQLEDSEEKLEEANRKLMKSFDESQQIHHSSPDPGHTGSPSGAVT